MRNKNVGYLVSGIAILIVIIIFIFNQGMTSIVNETCSHDPSCGMYKTINTQTYLNLAIAGIIHPVLAEIAMALSSITVVTNANLLRNKRI